MEERLKELIDYRPSMDDIKKVITYKNKKHRFEVGFLLGYSECQKKLKQILKEEETI